MLRKVLLIFLFAATKIAVAQQKSLDYFLEQAVKNSPLFIENKNQVAALKFDSLKVHSQYKPQVNFDSYNVYAPIVNGYGYDRAITNGGQLSALLGANLAITGKQNISNQIQGIVLQGQALMVAGRLSERELKKNISSQYILV